MLYFYHRRVYMEDKEKDLEKQEQFTKEFGSEG